ncbi:MAG: hypothetical protein GW805_09680 [Ignavibacteria bacterium]|nr:hypothetical protein [Ignavibacteria bacterium]NCS82413.1 hypothetical protein [Ignavibacteria bacterium]
MGGIVISEKEFSSADEFKNLHDYVERIFSRTKQGLAPFFDRRMKGVL